MPYLNQWQAEHAPSGSELVGMSTPELGFEHKRLDVAVAVAALGIRFPAGQDNDYQTLLKWENEAWPRFSRSTTKVGSPTRAEGRAMSVNWRSSSDCNSVCLERPQTDRATVQISVASRSRKSISGRRALPCRTLRRTRVFDNNFIDRHKI